MTASVLFCLTAVWTSALQRALDASASWVMERQIAEGSRTLVSSGTVECVAKSGIVWRVIAPFASSVAMTRDAMVFTDEEGERVKKMSDVPYYAAIRDKTDAFAAGDANAFDGLFEFKAQELGNGNWCITLTPEISDMRRLFTSVEVSGHALPTNVVMRHEGGGSSVLRFHAR